MGRKKIVKDIKPLVQSDFKSLIVSDTDFEENYIDPVTGRQAIFKCEQCKTYYQNTVLTEKKKEKSICYSCYELSKPMIFRALVPEDYKAEILYDTEFVTKKRMQDRTAIFKCQSCIEPFIANIHEEKMKNNARCTYCIEHPEQELLQSDFPIRLIKDIGMIRTSKNQKSHFGIFECGECKENFTRKASKVQFRGNTLCDRCSSRERHSGISRLQRTWSGMKSRTNRSNEPGSRNYICYVSKNIKICKEWSDFKTFEKWALDNGYDDTLSIDRKDNDGDYEPSNCRWTNSYVQSANTRKLRSTNTSGYRNVTWYKKKQKWKAQISVKNKRFTLGYFDDKIEAALFHDNYVIENNLPHTLNFER